MFVQYMERRDGHLAVSWRIVLGERTGKRPHHRTGGNGHRPCTDCPLMVRLIHGSNHGLGCPSYEA